MFPRAGKIEFFLRLHGLWEWERSGHRLPQAARRVERQRHQRVIDIPPTHDPPFDIETFEPIEPIEPPWPAIREWIPDEEAEPGGDLCDQRPESAKPVSFSFSIPTKATDSTAPENNRCRKKLCQSGADSHAPKQPDERIHFIAPKIPRKFPSRPRVELPIHPSSFGFHPSSAPLSPQTPSLPDARPGSDRFRCGGRESKFLQFSSQSDDFSYNVVKDPVHVHDFHATVLHLLGIDHERFTYRFQGLDFRLTGLEHANVVKALLA